MSKINGTEDEVAIKLALVPSLANETMPWVLYLRPNKYRLDITSGHRAKVMRRIGD